MLTLTSGHETNSRNILCDGFSRRDFLRIGGLAMGGLTLPQLLHAVCQFDVDGGRLGQHQFVARQVVDVQEVHCSAEH